VVEKDWSDGSLRAPRVCWALSLLIFAIVDHPPAGPFIEGNSRSVITRLSPLVTKSDARPTPRGTNHRIPKSFFQTTFLQSFASKLGAISVHVSKNSSAGGDRQPLLVFFPSSCWIFAFFNWRASVKSRRDWLRCVKPGNDFDSSIATEPVADEEQTPRKPSRAKRNRCVRLMAISPWSTQRD